MDGELGPGLGELRILQSLRRLGIAIGDSPVWARAFTHKSLVNETGLPAEDSNERLEFLGDAVIQLAVSEFLYEGFPKLPEGSLAKMRSHVVRLESLAQAAKDLDLGELLRLGKGAQMGGGRSSPSLLADLFEAVTGAIYVECGWEAARKFTLDALRERLASLKSAGAPLDPKTMLQELLQAESKLPPTYRLIDDSGPGHRRRFVSEVSHLGVVLGRGSGTSKKASEQAAARKALANMTKDPGELNRE